MLTGASRTVSCAMNRSKLKLSMRRIKDRIFLFVILFWNLKLYSFNYFKRRAEQYDLQLAYFHRKKSSFFYNDGQIWVISRGLNFSFAEKSSKFIITVKSLQ